MGFGNVDPKHGTQFAVVGENGKLYPIDLTLKNENRAAEKAALDKLVRKAQDGGREPGAAGRKLENETRSGRPDGSKELSLRTP